MASHIQRIERVEKDLDSLVTRAGTKKDLEGLRKEYRKLLVRSPRVPPPSLSLSESLNSSLLPFPLPLLFGVPYPHHRHRPPPQESEHLDSVELRARVWGIEQDLHALSKHASTSIRI